MGEKEMKRKKEEQLARRDASRNEAEKEVLNGEVEQAAVADSPSTSPVEEAKAPESAARQKRSRPFARSLRRAHVSERGESSTAGIGRMHRFSISSNDVSAPDTAPGLSKHGGLLAMLRKEKERGEREKTKDEEPEETMYVSRPSKPDPHGPSSYIPSRSLLPSRSATGHPHLSLLLPKLPSSRY